jgi:hypothetical protein
MLIFIFPKHSMPVFKIQNPSTIFIGKKTIFYNIHEKRKGKCILE